MSTEYYTTASRRSGRRPHRRARQGRDRYRVSQGDLRGIGGQPDYALAATWYRKAAEQAHTRAQINLAHLYETGLGVEKDPVTALRWYRQARPPD